MSSDAAAIWSSRSCCSGTSGAPRDSWRCWPTPEVIYLVLSDVNAGECPTAEIVRQDVGARRRGGLLFSVRVHTYNDLSLVARFGAALLDPADLGLPLG